LDCSQEIKDAIEESFQKAVYGDKGKDKKSRQPLLLGEKEIKYLSAEAAKIVQECGGDAKVAKESAEKWSKDFKANIKVMRDNTSLPGGIVSALFGRMVTSDPDANIDAPLHVAHSFTVHSEESESDYFTVVDDLKGNDEAPGTDHIGETELTSGLFYGYVVVDRGTLLRNLGDDKDLAGRVVENIAHLIATVSPGAKLGSTAPYGYAGWMLMEGGDRQPRSLAEAFRKPCAPNLESAQAALSKHITALDDNYKTGEVRRVMSLHGGDTPAAQSLPLDELAGWARGIIESGTA
ncbi:MAG: type I-E CRISPR-associated protein Cas7/Cse4/CasC, partial [Proteobacteria bacterium]|nr:type I-E CRISPR-associated protein Cas7/Cse4/CasC [Pseudomonadota bacterium]